MRVYAPATRANLQRLHTGASWTPTGPCFAVTPALRGWVESDGPADDEQLELVALTEAARESLRLLGPGATAPDAVRAVLALDLAADQVVVDDAGPEDPPGRVRVLVGEVPLARVAAVHADESENDRFSSITSRFVTSSSAAPPESPPRVSRLTLSRRDEPGVTTVPGHDPLGVVEYPMGRQADASAFELAAMPSAAGASGTNLVRDRN